MDYKGKDIKVLKGLEPVRQRPGMYVGSTGSDGLHHLIWEILDNSIDEYFAGYASKINICINTETNLVEIEDNGRGIPVDKIPEENTSALRVILGTLHAGGKFDHENYKVSGGLHGVGISVVNALSSSFVAQVKRDGFVYVDEYEKGIPLKKLKNGEIEPVGKCRKNDTGTKVSFTPDPQIFEDIVFDFDIIRGRLEDTTALNKGLEINLIFNDQEFNFISENGIIDILDKEIGDAERISRQIELPTLNLSENIDCDVVFQYIDENDERMKSFVNNIYTEDGGTHETEFKSALTRVINTYARDLNVNKKGFSGNDIRTGLVTIINLRIKNPFFAGQTKNKLDVPKDRAELSNLYSTKLTYYFDRNKRDLDQILTIINDLVESREKEKKISKIKKKKSSLAEKSGKLASATSNKPEEKELFIVEGDSAGGSAKLARDRKTQAILPLKGKIINVMTSTELRVMKNTEVATLIQVLGAGSGKDFDVSKLKYHKVIMMTDADVDGYHIRVLLINFFVKYMPELIKNGHLYAADPPLYRLLEKSGKITYLYSEEELRAAITGKKNYQISRFKGLGEMNPDQLKSTTMDKNSRHLKRITMEDIADSKALMKKLMGSNPALRKKLLFT